MNPKPYYMHLMGTKGFGGPGAQLASEAHPCKTKATRKESSLLLRPRNPQRNELCSRGLEVPGPTGLGFRA